MKSGFTVNHAKAGKKTIGTANPGNSSGKGMVKGRVIEMGMITHAKEKMDKKKLKITSPFSLHHFFNASHTTEASKPPIRFRPTIVPQFRKPEKSASVAKKWIRS